jgi:hypothetical protein
MGIYNHPSISVAEIVREHGSKSKGRNLEETEALN